MKSRHTFNLKSGGFDYTKQRNLFNQDEEKQTNPSNQSNQSNEEMVFVKRQVINKKINRFQKD